MSTQGVVVWKSQLGSADSSLTWDLFRQPAETQRGDGSGRTLRVTQASLGKDEGAGQGGERPAEGCTAGLGPSASLSSVGSV